MLNGGVTANLLNNNLVRERRAKPRINVEFPALVRGRDSAGKFQEDALIRNLSVAGLYLHTKRAVALGSSLFVTLQLSTQATLQNSTLYLATRGIVVRTEMEHDGTCNLAIKFERYRFLDSKK